MTTTQIFFFDARVQGWREAASALPAGSQWFEINSGKDGVEQIRQALSSLSGPHAIHIISHGSASRVQVGAGELSSATLAWCADALREIGASLVEGGDILVYGCSVGGGGCRGCLCSRGISADGGGCGGVG